MRARGGLGAAGESISPTAGCGAAPQKPAQPKAGPITRRAARLVYN